MIDLAYQRKRLRDFAAALRMSRELAERERWPVERLRAYQQERLDAVVRHAVAHSRFYRERFAGVVGDGPVDLARLPILDKAEMMERFDDLVTDPRLRRDELLAHVERIAGDELYLGRYRAIATSGSSGRKGLFVYDREGWRVLLATFLLHNERVGLKPRLPRRMRAAAVIGAVPTHMSRRISASVSLGLHRVLTLPVTLPVAQLVEQLNDFQPDLLGAYPSMAVRLAEEQGAGRLQISPRMMVTTSELRTPEMTERLVEAFGIQPFDMYATTEGLWGLDCERHEGIHLNEDICLVENVDADGRPVPPGEAGVRLLVTSLHNLAQPVIRLEVPDTVTMAPEPCRCGRTLMRMRSVEGRSDDVLALPGRNGRDVTVHPAHFALITRDRDVREFQVVQDGPRLRVRVVPRAAASAELELRLRGAVAARLAELGVGDPQVAVECCDELERSPGGKLQVVIANRDGGTATAVERV
jgi:phenylacetate-CoA ligase